ncbi:DnaB-like helicase C-terminal domain-containing protein [Pseudomonas alliivorans]|nr:DnaB-like helicase C-terminal domain-containing protein [Pseudomonas alliivorans]
MRDLYSLEAEHGLLGALLLDASLFDSVNARVTTADFAFDDNAALYQAIINTNAAGQPIDVVTVGIQYPNLPSGERTLGYAAEIAKNTPSTANWAGYQRIVLERSALRRVVAAADVIRDSASDSLPVAEIIAMAQQATADLRDLEPDTPKYLPVSDYVLQAAESVNDKANGLAPTWQSCGLPDLDKLMRGIRPKKITIIAGVPASGKTTLALQMAQYNAVKKGKPWLVFSLEMPGEELGLRTIASLGSIQLSRLDEPANMEDDDWARMTGAAAQTMDAPMFINDDPNLTAAAMRAIAKDCQRRHGLAGIMVDYLSLVKPEKSGRSRSEEVGATSKAFLRMAKELDVPVMALAQMNREYAKRAGKKPQMSDLRDSGEVEADASCILMLHRDPDSEAGQNGVTEVIQVKSRHARAGSCLLQQQGEYGRFVNFAGNPYATDEEVEMGRTSFASRFNRGSQS